MLYIFMGPGCSGKSTAADRIRERIGAEVFSGKDYLRLAKNEEEAWRLFQVRLVHAASKDSSEKTILYLVTEPAQLERVLNIKDIRKVRFSASFDVIKERFSRRMNGRMPDPVEKMLAKQYAQWEAIQEDFHVDTTGSPDPDDIADALGF